MTSQLKNRRNKISITSNMSIVFTKITTRMERIVLTQFTQRVTATKFKLWGNIALNSYYTCRELSCHQQNLLMSFLAMHTIVSLVPRPSYSPGLIACSMQSDCVICTMHWSEVKRLFIHYTLTRHLKCLHIPVVDNMYRLIIGSFTDGVAIATDKSVVIIITKWLLPLIRRHRQPQGYFWHWLYILTVKCYHWPAST